MIRKIIKKAVAIFKWLKYADKVCSLKYSCDEEYLKEFYKGKILKHSSLLTVLPGNLLDLLNSPCEYSFKKAIEISNIALKMLAIKIYLSSFVYQNSHG